MRIAVLAAVLAADLVACGDSAEPDIARARVALVPVAAKHDVDLLFVVDDSVSVLHLQASLKNAFPALLDELAGRGELPGLHVGVVSTDVGTLGAEDETPGPLIGSGPGSCSGTGRNGALRAGTMLVSGAFISDTPNGDGSRTTNYTGSVDSAFRELASLGSSGCGFEQPLEAMRRALDNHPMNAGFLRPEAALGIIVLVDEDDCSFVHASTFLGPDTTTLGPLQSFRCTRFGVQCDDGGATPDDLNVPGSKSACHWNETSEFLTARVRYEAFLAGVKSDKRDVMFGAIVAAGSTIEVEPRTPPGGGTAIPALAHGCTWDMGQGPAVADPAIRIDELTRTVTRGRSESICTSDYTSAVQGFAREIRGMLGDACLTREIAMPADCKVFDQTLARESEVPPCSASRATDCYQLVEDAACTTSQHLRVDVTRSSAPAADTMIAVRCRM